MGRDSVPFRGSKLLGFNVRKGQPLFCPASVGSESCGCRVLVSQDGCHLDVPRSGVHAGEDLVAGRLPSQIECYVGVLIIVEDYMWLPSLISGSFTCPDLAKRLRSCDHKRRPVSEHTPGLTIAKSFPCETPSSNANLRGTSARDLWLSCLKSNLQQGPTNH